MKVRIPVLGTIGRSVLIDTSRVVTQAAAPVQENFWFRVGKAVRLFLDGKEHIRVNENSAVAFQGAFGNTGQVLTSRGPGAAPRWEQPREGTGIQVDVYGSGSATWTKPAGAMIVEVYLCAGGGGGGSGRKATGGGASGGGGGGGAGQNQDSYLADDLTDTVTVTVGAGGTGGAAQTVAGTNGNAGVNGGDTSFGEYIAAEGGNAGLAGTATGGTAGAAGDGDPDGVAGGAGNDGAGANGTGSAQETPQCMGGGGGGGVTSGGAEGAGGDAGDWIPTSAADAGIDVLIPATGGAARANGQAGNATVNTQKATLYPRGGGGGAGGGSNGASINAGNGGDGYRGGGGGGGAGAQNAAPGDSGAGGDGGDGLMVVITYF